MKKRFIAMFAVVMAAIMLCSCGKTENPSPAPAPAEESSAGTQSGTEAAKATEAPEAKPEEPVEDANADQAEEEYEYSGDADDSALNEADKPEGYINFDDPADILGYWSSCLYDRSVYFDESGEFGYSYFDGEVAMGEFTLGDPSDGVRTYYTDDDVFRVYDANHIINSNCEMFTRVGYDGPQPYDYDDGATMTFNFKWNSADGDEEPKVDIIITDADGWRAHKTADEWFEDDGSVSVRYLIPGYFKPVRLQIVGTDPSNPFAMRENTTDFTVTISPFAEGAEECEYTQEYLESFVSYNEEDIEMYDVPIIWDQYELEYVEMHDYADELFGDAFYNEYVGSITCRWMNYNGEYPEIEFRLYDMSGEQIESEEDFVDGENVVTFTIEPGVYPVSLHIVGTGLPDLGIGYDDVNISLECTHGSGDEFDYYGIALWSLEEWWADCETEIGCYYIDINWASGIIGDAVAG